MKLPEDPNMLVSLINMKLRDGNYDSLSDLCLDLGIDEQDLKKRLVQGGYEFNEQTRQFR